MAEAFLGADATVAIVGGGFSGTLLAINLARFGGQRTVLIERRAQQMARGVAYSTPHPSQLLNVRASGMSALPDEPDHFARWLLNRGGQAADFVPRALYGAYLREMLVETVASAGGRLELRQGEACDVDAAGVVFADGSRLAADAVVLAVGNLPPHDPGGLDPSALPPGVYCRDPWADDPLAGLNDDDRVVLLGTGLTAVDVALTLDAAGFKGETLALSRRGLAPRRHVDGQPTATALGDPPQEPLSWLVRATRERAAATGWRAAVDTLRPVTQRTWHAADGATRARFLRHLRPFWDVHRHRLAPAVADRIEAMAASGALSFAAGKIVSVAPDPGGARLTWRPRHGDAVVETVARRIVNCTGPQGDLTRSDEPVVKALRDRGAIRPDRLRLGIEVDAQSRVVDRDGGAFDRLYCIGPMTRGGLWEVVAVPDLRRQAWDLARRLANAQWVGGEGL